MEALGPGVECIACGTRYQYPDRRIVFAFLDLTSTCLCEPCTRKDPRTLLPQATAITERLRAAYKRAGRPDQAAALTQAEVQSRIRHVIEMIFPRRA
jgi:hypothetical protein